MKITHNKVGQNLNLTDAGKLEKAEKSHGGAKDSKIDALLDTKSEPASNVHVSERARDIARIRQQVSAVPDVDAEKVAKFQKLIDSGEYKVDAGKVADKMVDTHLEFGD